MISFEDLNFAESGSTLPQIATLWTSQQENRTLYSRVTDNSSTLEAVRELLMEDNVVLSNFQPSLAVVVTWLRNTSVRLKIIASNHGLN